MAERKLDVLVVDDNADSAQTIAMLVGTIGHRARVATGGREALAAAAEQPPHAVILDLGMPDISGYDVAAELRRHFDSDHLCLVALTGWGDATEMARTRAAGFDHHLVKPIEPDELARILATLV